MKGATSSRWARASSTSPCSTSRSRPASSRSTRTSATAATRRSRTSVTTARSAARAAATSAPIPNNQYAFYLQDTWRVNDRLMLDLGLRYDLVTGFAFDQDDNIIFSELQAAGRAGRVQVHGSALPVPGPRGVRQGAEEDKNNIAPRVGFSYDVSGSGTLRAARRLRPLLRLRVHQRQHPVRGDRRAVVVRRDLREQRHGAASRTRTARSSRSASRCRRTSWPTPRRRCRATRPRPASSSPTRTRPTSASPGRSARASRSSWRASTRRAAISAPGRTSTCASTAGRGVCSGVLPTPATRTSASTPRTASPTTRA